MANASGVMSNKFSSRAEMIYQFLIFKSFFNFSPIICCPDVLVGFECYYMFNFLVSASKTVLFLQGNVISWKSNIISKRRTGKLFLWSYSKCIMTSLQPLSIYICKQHSRCSMFFLPYICTSARILKNRKTLNQFGKNWKFYFHI